MSNTNLAKFISLYKYIVQNNIYIPKLNDESEGLNYLYKMEELQNNDEEFLNDYLTFSDIHFIKENNILKIDYEWIVYYIWVILCIDDKLDLVCSTINILLNSNYLDEDKKEKIKMIMINCGKTPDVLNGWMEGHVMELMECMIDLDMEEEFKKITTDLSKSPLKSYRGIINYLFGYIGANVKDTKLEKYIDILNEAKLIE